MNASRSSRIYWESTKMSLSLSLFLPMSQYWQDNFIQIKPYNTQQKGLIGKKNKKKNNYPSTSGPLRQVLPNTETS